MNVAKQVSILRSVTRMRGVNDEIAEDSMNTDFRISVGFPEHVKTQKLMRRLKHEGIVSLIFLWAYASANRWDGVLSGLDEEEIALAAKWAGDPHAFVRTLTEIGFLEKTEAGVFAIHDWMDHNPWAASHSARRERAQNAARSRWQKGSEASENQAISPGQSSTDTDGPLARGT